MSQFSPNLSSGHPTNKTEYHYKGPDSDSQCHSSHQTCHRDILQTKQNITTRDLTMTVSVTVLTKHVIGTSYKQNGISLQGTWQWQSMSQFSSNLSSWHPTNKTEYHYKGPDSDSQCHSSHQICHQDILQTKQNITTIYLTVTVNDIVLTKLVIRTSYKQTEYHYKGPDNDSQCHSSHQTCLQDILQIKQNITSRTWQWQSMSQFSSNLSSGHPTNKTEYHYKGPDNDSQYHSSHQTCHEDIIQIKQNITTRDLTMIVIVTVLTKLVIRTSFKQNRISLHGTWQWQSMSQLSSNLSSGLPTNKTEYHYKGPDNNSQCHSSHQTCHHDILQTKQNITTRDLTMTENVIVLIKLVIRTSYK